MERIKINEKALLLFVVFILSFLGCNEISSKNYEDNIAKRKKKEQDFIKVNNELSSKDIGYINIGGVLGERLQANLENWELEAYYANPAMVEMFFDRDRSTPSNSLTQQSKLNPWSGEFVGKYLCASISSYQILNDPRQKELIDEVVAKLLESQGENGYLGPFDKEYRLTGPNTWDFWGHYWTIRALLMYAEEFNSEIALKAARKAADMIIDKFLNNDIHWINDGLFGLVNYAIIDAFAQLYIKTGDQSYLDMAHWIENEWDLPEVNLRYISRTLAGEEMHEFCHPANRWESLHDFLGIHKMYLITGEHKYRDAFVKLWKGIQRSDIHNTGGFTTGEAAIGNPYAPGVIETCCTVAWIDISTEMIKLTGNSTVADELELSTFNGLLGAQHPSGRWWTYNTPMDGVKKSSVHSVFFQAKPGSPELNCCSVNGPRGLSLLSRWAFLKSKEGVVVNFYGQSQFEIQTPNKQNLKISQTTNYPSSGKILIDLKMDRPESFSVHLRIPSWSLNTIVKVNGEPVESITEGTYLDLSRTWKNRDQIELNLDMSPHYWLGDRDLAGKTSIYSGPILLAYDPVYNEIPPNQIPEFSAKNLKLTNTEDKNRTFKPVILFSIIAENGREIQLVDFATAGAYGNKYVTWLPITGVDKKMNNPLLPIWANRPSD